MQKTNFGELPDGRVVEAWTLQGSRGASLEFLSYGGIVRSLHVPDRAGQLGDVVLGFDRLEPYLARHPYFGAITGRIAGRIPGGRLTVGGRTHELVLNDGPNHLHGGLNGLDRRLWHVESVTRPDGADCARLTYLSPDGEEGYPGRAFFSLTYALTHNNVFEIESEVAVDRETPVSITHHGYFNLAGEGSGVIFDHEVAIFCDRTIAVDDSMTPLGRAEAVSGRATDFNTPRRLGDAIPELFRQHGDCYAVQGGEGVRRVARVVDPSSGRSLEVSTDEHCLQFYTGVHLDGTQPGKSGRSYEKFAGLCLECHGYPAAVEFPEFGDIMVRPGTPQRHTTRYAFSTTQSP